MADTYSNILQLRLQETGANAGTWGQLANDAVFELLEDAVAGIVSVSSNDGTITLTRNQGSTDESRMAQIVVAGALTSSVVVVAPSISKYWAVRNNTTQASVGSTFGVTFKLAGGTGVIIPASEAVYLVVSDGVKVRETQVSTSTSLSGRLVGVTVFTSTSAQFLPSSSARTLVVHLVGGGGGGGSASSSGAGDFAVGGGGGGGGYAFKVLTTVAAFTSIDCSVGKGGATNVAGGATFFGVVSVGGGGLGTAGTNSTGSAVATGGAGGTAAGGDINSVGGGGGFAWSSGSAGIGNGSPGTGGSSFLGGGGEGRLSTTGAAGGAGAGGGGAFNGGTAGTFLGGAGGDGRIIVEQYT